ncbi:hypothetical protein [Burkholderia gladioli]|nr:hypothetical protein [Burkholderia gladioli]
MPDFVSLIAVLATFAVCAVIGSRLTAKREAKMTDEERSTMQTW